MKERAMKGSCLCGAVTYEMTPFDMKIKKGAESFDVLIKLDGYTTATRSISSDKSYAVLVPLTKNAAATPQPVQQAANVTPPPNDKGATPAVDAPAKDKHHHHSSTKGDTGSADKSATKDKPAGKSTGKDEGDDMKLLQPKF